VTTLTAGNFRIDRIFQFDVHKDELDEIWLMITSSSKFKLYKGNLVFVLEDKLPDSGILSAALYVNQEANEVGLAFGTNQGRLFVYSVEAKKVMGDPWPIGGEKQRITKIVGFQWI
jgi:hypothetical protein